MQCSAVHRQCTARRECAGARIRCPRRSLRRLIITAKSFSFIVIMVQLTRRIELDDPFLRKVVRKVLIQTIFPPHVSCCVFCSLPHNSVRSSLCLKAPSRRRGSVSTNSTNNAPAFIPLLRAPTSVPHVFLCRYCTQSITITNTSPLYCRLVLDWLLASLDLTSRSPIRTRPISGAAVGAATVNSAYEYAATNTHSPQIWSGIFSLGAVSVLVPHLTQLSNLCDICNELFLQRFVLGHCTNWSLHQQRWMRGCSLISACRSKNQLSATFTPGSTSGDAQTPCLRFTNGTLCRLSSCVKHSTLHSASQSSASLSQSIICLCRSDCAAAGRIRHSVVCQD